MLVDLDEPLTRVCNDLIQRISSEVTGAEDSVDVIAESLGVFAHKSKN